MSAPRRLTRTQARRVAIAATGLGERRPSAAAIGPAHVRKVLDRVGLLQLDSVNAVARAHELLLFSRLGPFDPKVLHRLTYERRELYEGWLHVASLIPIDWWPRLAWKRADLHHTWVAYEQRERKVLDEVRALIADDGAIGASDLEHLGRSSGSWWGWSRGKSALEFLFRTGEVAVATRRGAFERVYDLAERVIPDAVRAAPEVGETDARRRMLVRAAGHLGVGTLKDLVDYYRQKVTDAKPIVRDLVVEGALVEVDVEGWTEPAYALPVLTVPRRGCPDGRLVSPFDPLVWYRPRNVRLFDFDYTIEIYTPEPKRVYGYYVLPFLQGDRIVARVDVRADRRNGVLRVPGAYVEDGATVDVAGLADELRLLASWQGCDEVVVGDRGDLAPALRKVLP
ncbi:MAG TPA: crosslink repair DNA glycosylase YcaQ family protein [Acidimicrobiales bacterium]|nr:crosslink repair DNA glycosylase YcaQ family protein [Acidimicrobiales bacterium]